MDLRSILVSPVGHATGDSSIYLRVDEGDLEEHSGIKEILGEPK